MLEVPMEYLVKNTLQFTQASIKMPTQMIKDIKTVTLTMKASVVYKLWKVENILYRLGKRNRIYMSADGPFTIILYGSL